ncbi:MAG: beta-hydroxyacyl-ACP dehydratase [Prevotellaceae bacterium]|nr:beta-hydroxyacyl-ACP dehydratase [Prevotellaceae bacterium]
MDDFYRVEQATGADAEFEYRIALNKEHFIYRAHFPGNPITPGVCIIQLCKELMELRVKKPLFLNKILNVKFLSVVNPTVYEVVQVAFSKIIPSESGYKFSVVVYSGATHLAKLSLTATIQ